MVVIQNVVSANSAPMYPIRSIHDTWNEPIAKMVELSAVQAIALPLQKLCVRSNDTTMMRI